MRDKLPQTGYTKLPEPTKIEVEIALEMLSEKHHRAFSYDEAARFISLNKALKMWEEIEKDLEDGKGITKKDAKEMQGYFKRKGEKVSLERSYLEAEKALITNITTEMLKITSELEELINDHLS